MRLYVKDLGGVPVIRDLMLRQGTTTNDSADAGDVGEYIASVIASGSAVALATGTQKNLTSISLTAGDWDVNANFSFVADVGVTTVNFIIGSISTTSATGDATNGRMDTRVLNNAVINVAPLTAVVPPVRISIAATTTVYAVANQNFGVSTLSVYGLLRARRVR